MVGEQELKDSDPIKDFIGDPWCIVFTNDRGALLPERKVIARFLFCQFVPVGTALLACHRLFRES